VVVTHDAGDTRQIFICGAIAVVVDPIADLRLARLSVTVRGGLPRFLTNPDPGTGVVEPRYAAKRLGVLIDKSLVADAIAPVWLAQGEQFSVYIALQTAVAVRTIPALGTVASTKGTSLRPAHRQTLVIGASCNHAVRVVHARATKVRRSGQTDED
jgi:hypothetical protein